MRAELKTEVSILFHTRSVTRFGCGRNQFKPRLTSASAAPAGGRRLMQWLGRSSAKCSTGSSFVVLPCDAIDPGQNLVRHELHGAPRERGIDPVVPRVEEGAECADLVAQREYPIRDGLRGSGN